MDPSTLATLIVELFTAIRLVSGYPAPDTLPEVRIVPETEIQQRLCGGRACRVRRRAEPRGAWRHCGHALLAVVVLDQMRTQ